MDIDTVLCMNNFFFLLGSISIMHIINQVSTPLYMVIFILLQDILFACATHI